ncbi:polar amino acid ABC transporter ATP-binding protein [Clostridium polyendosporum]|uniref:Polar amino acid ABC transporter ATP-binding protein n=1 Tax=Clostridium polyendosporum TaxID=69208 RepID=A0A919S0T1_9CLOT|nr:amino acid ABC transporter ATP-binding protein [Clostridium polyendosporum]GIM29722.1 polar amino acid ABC transporter ATP-binding protein [Clostridium polyendosporum]
MLKVEGLEKKFGKNTVLKGVNLEIKEGEITVIVGPSGGGKTTLLRCISGLTQPDNGSIIINNKYLYKDGKIAQKKDELEIRKDVGLVFQNFNLFPHMSVLENITEAPRVVLGMDIEEAKNKAKEILGFLGLENKQTSYPFELSGGQKQRVAIGRALAMEPKLICFDEPTSALDPSMTGEVANLIKKLSLEKSMTVLIITHDMAFATMVAHRILSMNNGILKEEHMYM